ncbi:diapolycopene oxygenase [Planococcus glaciei]|uniref:4,4'-diaponeurosporene oxygenase n=1 Tax=Planococcus glaciei TaxID=459472 RepID=A0A1G8BJY8_9BACL|nr:phytoene desaturase family protein [Planococcus glaciei]MCP2035535.1 diapolycopene oxygenase [Planomicrobium sp. HSC-17F08]KOF09193.1 diapolycopene oxygenase [Planococcus glaciei]MBX0315263.1 phytoene desaturase [Planococcus glaciei]QKX51082.1 phytoene desaturase [Planococcus glaciei]SDH33354.1 diapolycopene oxygenase [Planococcus glaciei]
MANVKKSVIVIGGGLGGLSAAISLAQNGYSVSLYEKNDHIGGKLNRLEQDGFGFDLGPSILTMPHIFDKLFRGSGKRMEDYVPIKRLNREWRSFFPDGTVLDLFHDLRLMERANPSLSRKDMKEYYAFLKYAKKIYETTEDSYLGEGFDTAQEAVAQNGIIATLTGFDLTSTVYEAVSKRISNPHLRDMLSYFVKYVGSSPYQAPAVLNMMIYMQHAQGCWYVPGGMHKLGEGLTRLAKEEGVRIHTGQAVVRAHTDNKRQITAIELEDGSIKKADYFVSNMEVIPFYKKMVDAKPKYVENLEKKFEPASSGLVLHLGVNKTYPFLNHHNFFFPENLEDQMEKVFVKHELPDDPTIYLVNTNKTDPTQAPPGHENLKILPHIPYIQDNPFTPDDYLKFEARVYEKLERMGLHGLRDHIVTRDVWTPHDIERTYGSDRGAIYGTVSDKKGNGGFKNKKESELYDNLYFVGGTVNPGGGMPMVTLSGQQVSQKIVKRDSLVKQ